MTSARRTGLCWLALCAACSTGASRDPGLEAELRVQNGYYVPGPLPGPADGPEIISLRVPHDEVLPGVRSEFVTGSLAEGTSSVLIELADDSGHWIVRAGAPSIDEPRFPTFEAQLAFARDTTRDERALTLCAVDPDGRVGPHQSVALTVADRVLAGELVVRLTWDTEADLDLHVVSADGEEVWAGNINSTPDPAPGQPPGDPQAFRAGGILDFDSNADCMIDGRREENVIWSAPPPSGAYVVRVATTSLCSARVAHWQVDVWLHDQRLALARGTSLSSDTRTDQGAGAGAQAVSFDVP